MVELNLINNTANYGGAIYIHDQNLTLNNCNFTSNTGLLFGGAINDGTNVRSYNILNSYFFNNTNTNNLSESETWYEDPSPVDTLYTNGRSETINNNHRLNARLDWKISRNQSLMSRTSLSYQGNNPFSTTEGYQYGESGLLYQYDQTLRKSHGLNFTEFLQNVKASGDSSFKYLQNCKAWSYSYR